MNMNECECEVQRWKVFVPQMSGGWNDTSDVWFRMFTDVNEAEFSVICTC